jgi:hypothetical protein
MSAATDVVVSGCSAGGLATFLHADKWHSRMPAGAHVVAMPDSGFFLDYEAESAVGEGDQPHNCECCWPASLCACADVTVVVVCVRGADHNEMVWVFNQMNVSSGIDEDCIAHYSPSGNAWMCYFAEHTAPFLSTPTFPLQSQYDSWQIGNVSVR